MHDARKVLLYIALKMDVGVDQAEQEANNGFEVVILQIAENYCTDLLVIVVQRQELDDALDVRSERLFIEVTLESGCGWVEDSCPPLHQQLGSICTSFATKTSWTCASSTGTSGKYLELWTHGQPYSSVLEDSEYSFCAYLP